jgi:transketolase N-terminal domain/subunit
MTALLSTTSSLAETELARVRRLTADTIRGLAMDAVQKANSGHPGMPMGMADAAVVLWTGFLKHNPADPLWADRDREKLVGSSPILPATRRRGRRRRRPANSG